MSERVGTLIIGAGVIGSSVAAALARRGVSGIRVVDLDLEGSFSSSELNAGGVRATWVQPINIEMARITIEYLRGISREVGYRDCGYLWLHRPDTMEAAIQARERQARAGWEVNAWDVATLKRRLPIIDKTDDLAGAIFSPRDGLVNPNLLKNHFRTLARGAGAIFEDRIWIQSAEFPAASAHKVTVRAAKLKTGLTPEEMVQILGHGTTGESTPIEFHADRVINCAGAWASPIARKLQYESPCFAMRRQVSIFGSRDVDMSVLGMVIDPSGVYFHPEASNGLAGFAVPNESRGINYTSDGEAFFMEHIWPALHERSTKFEKLKFLTGWSGQYEVSPDESAVIGRVEDGAAGKSGAVFEAHSFSGHGIMHSFSASEALSELIVEGRPGIVDLAPLSGSRFKTGKLVRESQII